MTDREVSLVVWAVLGVTLVGLQVVAVRSDGRFPGLGELVTRLTLHRAGRVTLLVGWMWLGWHAFAR
jgi:hypothetical protein